jgi:hypothetical protein
MLLRPSLRSALRYVLFLMEHDNETFNIIFNIPEISFVGREPGLI